MGSILKQRDPLSKRGLELAGAEYLVDLYRDPAYKESYSNQSAKALRELARRGVSIGRGERVVPWNLGEMQEKLKGQYAKSKAKGRKIAEKERRFSERRREIKDRSGQRRGERRARPIGRPSERAKKLAASRAKRPLSLLSEAEKNILSAPGLKGLAAKAGKLGGKFLKLLGGKTAAIAEPVSYLTKKQLEREHVEKVRRMESLSGQTYGEL